MESFKQKTSCTSFVHQHPNVHHSKYVLAGHSTKQKFCVVRSGAFEKDIDLCQAHLALHIVHAMDAFLVPYKHIKAFCI